MMPDTDSIILATIIMVSGTVVMMMRKSNTGSHRLDGGHR